MASVHIGIRHQDDLVVTQLRNIEIIAISFRKAAAERIDHRLDLGIRQHLVHRSFLHI